MADINVIPFPKPLREIEPLDFQVTKLSPVAGEVLLLQIPEDANHGQAMHALQALRHIAPEGVYVACIDSAYRLIATNAPAILAMLQKPEVTH